jgi:hypothetical protein
MIVPPPQVSIFKTKELNGELLPEPLLTPDLSRFVVFPIRYDDVSLGYMIPMINCMYV